MTTIAASPLSFATPRVPPWWSTVAALAARELRDAVRSRWFVLYTLAFALLGLGISYISAAGSGASGMSGMGRTTAGLVNLVILVVPLMALTAGAGSIASDRERGSLAFLLAQPVARWEVLIAKYLGLALSLLACLCLGLGACAAILAWNGGSSQPMSLIYLTGLAFFLALSMLAIGMLVSTLARKASVAVGTVVFLWLVLVFVSDLGLMAGAVAFKLHVANLFHISLLNPLQVFKMWSLESTGTSLDVLGPAGAYAMDVHGQTLPWLFGASLGAWTLVPLGAAGVVFSRKSGV